MWLIRNIYIYYVYIYIICLLLLKSQSQRERERQRDLLSAAALFFKLSKWPELSWSKSGTQSFFSFSHVGTVFYTLGPFVEECLAGECSHPLRPAEQSQAKHSRLVLFCLQVQFKIALSIIKAKCLPRQEETHTQNSQWEVRLYT